MDVIAEKTEKIMAVTTHIDHFHSADRADRREQGFFARLITRICLNCEARAIRRLETEAAHLLGPDHLRHIKADYAVRKAKALK